MRLTVLETHGLKAACIGMRLSRGSEDKSDSSLDEIGPLDEELMLRLIAAGDEHAKFARFIVSWIEVRAPRYWWQEMATYKIGAEWLSESTMYTLCKDLQRIISPAQIHERFFAPEVDPHIVSRLQHIARIDHPGDLDVIKANLPEGFLQGRIGVLNAQSLRRIYWQRKDHRLAEWRSFCEQLLAQYPYPQLIDPRCAIHA